MPGVTAVSEATADMRAAVSDVEGRFMVMDLSAGRYRLRGVLPGFGSELSFVTVEVDETSTEDLLLSLAPLTETMNVTRADQGSAEVPQSVAVVPRDQIEFAQRRASLEEALRGVPGLFV